MSSTAYIKSSAITVTLDYYPKWLNRDEAHMMGATTLTIDGKTIVQMHTISNYPMKLQLDWVTRAQLDNIITMAESYTIPLIEVKPENNSLVYTCVFDPTSPVSDVSPIVDVPVTELSGTIADRYNCVVNFVVLRRV